MRIRTRPVDPTFHDLFAESAQHLVVGSTLLAEMLDPDADRVAIGRRMRDAEQEADETTHRIVRQLAVAAVPPFGRDDVYLLAVALDDVMDDMEEAVDLAGLYQLDELPPGLADLVDVLQRGCRLTVEAMARLRSMTDLEEYWIEINRLENEGTRSYRRIMAGLLDGSYKTLHVMRLRSVVDALEHAIGALEKVATTVERIAVKES